MKTQTGTAEEGSQPCPAPSWNDTGDSEGTPYSEDPASEHTQLQDQVTTHRQRFREHGWRSALRESRTKDELMGRPIPKDGTGTGRAGALRDLASLSQRAAGRLTPTSPVTVPCPGELVWVVPTSVLHGGGGCHGNNPTCATASLPTHRGPRNPLGAETKLSRSSCLP